ncbi:MAG: shikimate kinase [Clostridiales bacterium]|nr:shikimate kinase [Clostridiales bacterium]
MLKKGGGVTDNIILIGMPGSGKSTIGVVLAKRLGYDFTDGDLLIQKSEKKLLHRIIEEKGIEGFIETENRVNCTIDCDRTVIATGGSAVYGSEAMEHFKKIGRIVFLHLSCNSLKTRLGDLNKRGVAIKEGQTLLDLYNERLPLYKKYADTVINCNRKSIRKIVWEIEKRLSPDEDF